MLKKLEVLKALQGNHKPCENSLSLQLQLQTDEYVWV
jgi:hypothetical protein